MQVPSEIEDLPAEVLRRVTAFLPLKEAVRTSLLSTSWRDLWRPRIVDLNYLNSEHFMQITGKYFKPYDEVHQVLRLCSRDRVDIQIVAAKGVEGELYLDFSHDERELETQLYYALTLNALIMDKSSIITSFASLKSLTLKSVTPAFMEVSSVIYSSCVLLERLKVEQCSGLESLDVAGSGRLEEVVVLDCPDMAEISISLSGLKCFTYRGSLPRINMKNSYNLVDVTLELTEGLGQHVFDCEEVLSLFASLRNVGTLNITGWLLEVQ